MKNDNKRHTEGGNSEIPTDQAEHRAQSIAAFDRSLLGGARRALDAAGVRALEFLAANPGMPTVALAKRLNRGATAIGLVMAIYDEAIQNGTVRDVAKDLLIREICGAFPHGWPGLYLVRPLVSVVVRAEMFNGKMP